MTQLTSDGPTEDFFNDPARSMPESHGRSSLDESGHRDAIANSADQSKAKRIACILCRKRKLRCDGARPTCGTCKRLSHDCSYDEVRKKSGPKRGYVKLLEARLQQVESMLKSHDSTDSPGQNTTSNPAKPQFPSPPQDPFPIGRPEINPLAHAVNVTQDGSRAPPFGAMPDLTPPTSNLSQNSQDGLSLMDATPSFDPLDPNLSWEMIGLGLEEQLPSAELIEDLHNIFFARVLPSLPMIHRPRYLAAMSLPPNLQPPIYLRYIIWCLAASTSDKYESFAEIFYNRARKYVHLAEMKGHGEGIIALAHCQAFLLIALYEFKNMYFPRAWLSVGRASRAAQMMGLHRLDGIGLDVKQCLPPPRDWTEREERRRVFWASFCEDRYSSVGTGWPMTFDEQDIMTNLPASEEAFDCSQPEPSITLEQAYQPGGVARASRFGAKVLMTALFGRNLHHLHRQKPDDDENNLDGAFWRRHRTLESILSSTALSLPDNLRMPAGIPDPNVIYVNLALQTATICLHQAAIFKADRSQLSQSMSGESRLRCVSAAAETTRLMKMISHVDLSGMNPFLAFCLYVAARVFVQYLKFRPTDYQVKSSLSFLLDAMHALKRKNALTSSFLVQLDVDIEGAKIDIPRQPIANTMVMAENLVNNDSVRCSPLFEIRSSQGNADFTMQPPHAATASRVNSLGSSNDQGESPGASFAPTATVNLMDATNVPHSFNLPHHQKSSRGGVMHGFVQRGNLDFTDMSSSDPDRSPAMTMDNGSSRAVSSPENNLTPGSTDANSPNVTLQNGQSQSQSKPSAQSFFPNPQNTINGGNHFSTDPMFDTTFSNDFNLGSFNNTNAEFMTFNAASPGNGLGGGTNDLFASTGQTPGMSGAWEMSGIELNGAGGGGGTGMTPGPGEMNWGQVLEEMKSWEGMDADGAGFMGRRVDNRN